MRSKNKIMAITGNSVGVKNSAGGPAAYSFGNNQFRSNGTDVSGGLTAITLQ